MMLALAVVAMLQGAAEPVPAPMVTARITPEAPAIGEPITVELRVRAPVGSEVRFPVLPDTGTRVEPLDPRALFDASTASYVDRTARYRLIAWDTGSVTLTFGDVRVLRDGAERRFPVALAPLVIRSVLPADTSAHVPRPARGPGDVRSLRWHWWVVAAALLTLALWGWRRGRARRAVQATSEADVAERTRDAFAHIRALDLLAAGEPGRHVLAHARTVREYVGARWPSLPTSLTAAELAERLPQADFPVLPERLLSVVARAETLAYARSPLSNEESERLALECTAMVEDMETAWSARADQAAAESGKRRRKARR